MSYRRKHNLELPTIAQAIDEYRTSSKTQKECADEYGIPIKVFSYYYLNGFKKTHKMNGGNNIMGINNNAIQNGSTGIKRKTKSRDVRYDVEIIKGHECKEIASALDISENTVNTHIKNIYKKCSINNRIELLNIFKF